MVRIKKGFYAQKKCQLCSIREAQRPTGNKEKADLLKAHFEIHTSKKKKKPPGAGLKVETERNTEREGLFQSPEAEKLHRVLPKEGGEGSEASLN